MDCARSRDSPCRVARARIRVRAACDSARRRSRRHEDMHSRRVAQWLETDRQELVGLNHYSDQVSGEVGREIDDPRESPPERWILAVPDWCLHKIGAFLALPDLQRDLVHTQRPHSIIAGRDPCSPMRAGVQVRQSGPSEVVDARGDELEHIAAEAPAAGPFFANSTPTTRTRRSPHGLSGARWIRASGTGSARSPAGAASARRRERGADEPPRGEATPSRHQAVIPTPGPRAGSGQTVRPDQLEGSWRLR